MLVVRCSYNQRYKYQEMKAKIMISNPYSKNKRTCCSNTFRGDSSDQALNMKLGIKFISFCFHHLHFPNPNPSFKMTVLCFSVGGLLKRKSTSCTVYVLCRNDQLIILKGFSVFVLQSCRLVHNTFISIQVHFTLLHCVVL